MTGVLLMADPRVVATPLRECGAPLVDLRRTALTLDDRKQDAAGAWAHLRRGLVRRLEEAQSLLPAGTRLLMIEDYRPPRLQQLYFTGYRDRLAALHPEWSADELDHSASRYVSPPGIAPHSAGAAVDLTLCTDDGVELDMGTRVDATPEESDGACYTDSPAVTGAARRNRDTMSAVLGAVGLVNYPTEWWHWSFGDRYWATVTGAATACYGPVELPVD